MQHEALPHVLGTLSAVVIDASGLASSSVLRVLRHLHNAMVMHFPATLDIMMWMLLA